MENEIKQSATPAPADAAGAWVTTADRVPQGLGRVLAHIKVRGQNQELFDHVEGAEYILDTHTHSTWRTDSGEWLGNANVPRWQLLPDTHATPTPAPATAAPGAAGEAGEAGLRALHHAGLATPGLVHGWDIRLKGWEQALETVENLLDLNGPQAKQAYGKFLKAYAPGWLQFARELHGRLREVVAYATRTHAENIAAISVLTGIQEPTHDAVKWCNSCGNTNSAEQFGTKCAECGSTDTGEELFPRAARELLEAAPAAPEAGPGGAIPTMEGSQSND